MDIQAQLRLQYSILYNLCLPVDMAGLRTRLPQDIKGPPERLSWNWNAAWRHSMASAILTMNLDTQHLRDHFYWCKNITTFFLFPLLC